ncbi:MAG: TolC family protein [Alistipes sp.]|nr:TolC family protein [Alistipes sp.]
MKRLLLVITSLLGVATLSAQTLDQCRQMARENYPEIAQYDLIARTEQYNLSNAARAWIPQLSLSAQATYQSATPTYPEAFDAILSANGIDMAGIRRDQYKVALDVSQTIWDGGQSKANRTLAEAEAAEQRSAVDVSLYDLMQRVDNLYFGILLLDERVAMTEALIGVLESNLRRMQSYLDNGVAMQSDVDNIEAELLSAKQTLGEVEASRASYRRMLEIFIGEPLNDTQLSRPAMTEVKSRTSARPELDLFEAREGRIAAQRRAINNSVMPRFAAFAQGYYGYPGMDMFKSMVSPEWSLNAMVGIRMSWNIGAFYTKRNNLEKLNAQEAQIAIQRDVFLFNSRMQTAEEDGEIARLKEALEEDDRIVELRRNVRMAAESKLENGVIDATDLLQKISDETRATINRSTHQIELLRAVYQLKHTLNQ